MFQRFLFTSALAVRLRTSLAHARGTITRLAESGTHPYPPEVRRRLKILNLVAYLIAATTFVYLLQQFTMSYDKYKPIIWLNAALIPFALAVPLAHRINEIAGGLLLLTTEYVAQLLFIAHLGRDSGMQLHFFVAAAAPFLVFGLQRLPLIAACVIGAMVLHLAAWFAFPPNTTWIAAEAAILDGLYVQAAVTTMVLLAASVWYAFSLAEEARAETDRLMRRILPDKVVERVKAAPGQLVADTFDTASVLFADMSGFVALSRKLGPTETVALLNRIVNEFDCLAAKHGVEKIKTIGDAYMAVAGVPEPVSDPCGQIVRLALDMLAELARIRDDTGLALNMRIGIATGGVLAGVIGADKFTYDVWGDTVNLAARLEQTGVRDRIQICPLTRHGLGRAYPCEARAPIDIKGLGPVETWLLASAATPAVTTPRPA
jgi:adenylate cyclase